MEKKNKLFNVKPGDTLSFGVIMAASGVQFSVYLPDEKDCKLKFYYIGRKEPACVIPLTDEYKRGGVYFITITGINSGSRGRSLAQVLSQDFEYMYEADGKEFIDPYAHIIHGKSTWGKVMEESQKRLVRGGICFDSFDWEGDRQIRRPFSEVILYQLNNCLTILRGEQKDIHKFDRVKISCIVHYSLFYSCGDKINMCKIFCIIQA